MSTNPKFDNFFALFDQPVTFAISISDLEQKLRALQKQYHPDNTQNHAHDTISKQQAESTSALINHAYQTLKSPDSRAEYLLEMASQGIDLNQSIADLDFLDDAIELRMDLDDAMAASDAQTLKHLYHKVNTRIEQQSERFMDSYAKQDWQTASDATQKLKFLVKLNADIDGAFDNLSQSHQDDDDDLYV